MATVDEETKDLHPAVGLLKTLMNIESTSEIEHDIGVFLEGYLQGLGWTVERVAIAPGSPRHNVYAYLGPPSRRRCRLLVTAHMDTVPPHIPFSLSEDRLTVRGRGSCDDLGPMVAQILAVEELRAEGKGKGGGVVSEEGGDVSFLFVVGEEKGGAGMLAANDMGLDWDAAIFAEPTEGKLGKGHKGNLVFELEAHGKACHSGYPHLGKSANLMLVGALSDLAAAEWPSSELLGPSTFNIGKMEGGAAYNVVAASATALCSIRVAADLEGIKRQAAEIVASRHPGVEIRFSFGYPEVPLDWEFASAAAGEGDGKGGSPLAGLEAAPLAYGTDVPRLKGDHRKVLYGPGSILFAHGEDEHIGVEELVGSIDVYKKLAVELLKK